MISSSLSLSVCVSVCLVVFDQFVSVFYRAAAAAAHGDIDSVWLGHNADKCRCYITSLH